MHSKILLSLGAALALCSTTLASTLETPDESVFLAKRANGQCAVCDVGPGDCKGKDLDAYNKCVAVTKGSNGDCLDLAEGTGAQDGCLAAQITINKPCENACVQKQLRNAYCRDNPKGKWC